MKHQKKTWWHDVKNDVNSFGLSWGDAQVRSAWRRKVKRHLASARAPGKKMLCICGALVVTLWTGYGAF